MTERRNLLAAITNTIRDYRAGEIPKPTPEHVDKWIRQFDENVQLPMLRELNHVFKFTYISKHKALHLLRQIAGNFPCDFWRETHVLDIQKNGRSQREIRELFRQILREQCGCDVGYWESDDIEYWEFDEANFIYLDDAICTGKHVIDDLSYWMRNQAIENSTLHIIVFAVYQLGKYWIGKEENLERLKTEKQISINFQIFFDEFVFENRRSYRNQSDVLWPTAEIFSDPSFEPRQPESGRESPFYQRTGPPTT